MSSPLTYQAASAASTPAESPALAVGQDVGRDLDVLAQQARQLLAGGLAVEGLDGVADVVLVARQAVAGDAKVGQVVNG